MGAISESQDSRHAIDASLHEAVYPAMLRNAENECINERRVTSSPGNSSAEEANNAQQAGRASLPAHLPPDTLGLAFSGGGIRSATFCLGILNSMARSRLLCQVDFLSTVSGGGYIGGFLGSLFTRRRDPEGVTKDLTDQFSFPMRWLRENGRYLAPNGSGDLLTALSVHVRNWCSVMLVMAVFGSSLFLAADLLRAWLENSEWSTEFLKAHFSARPGAFWWWSPYFCLAAVAGAAAALFGAAYFLIPRHHTTWLRWPWWPAAILIILCTGLYIWPGSSAFYGDAIAIVGMFSAAALLLWLGSWVYAAIRNGYDSGTMVPEIIRWQRRWLSTMLSGALVITSGLLVFSLLDTLGQSLYLSWQTMGVRWLFHTFIAASGLATLFSLGPKLAGFGRWISGGIKGKIPLNAWAAVASLAFLGIFLLNLDLVGHAIAWNWGVPKAGNPNIAALAAACCISLLLSILFGRYFTFLHQSSLQSLYGARLARAYLGASNKLRAENPQNWAVTEMIAGDDVYLKEYRPHKFRGPLHLINLTFNETCSAKSNIEQRDRKGLQFAIGPCGISVGRTDHALWATNGKSPAGTRIAPITPSGGARKFAIFPPAPAGYEVENISIGHWIALSGAAFGTGLGYHTKLGLSLLAGLANVRLGYWWNSSIHPGDRPAECQTKLTFPQKLGNAFTWLFPVQSYLLDEWLARFHGPARRYWYLSDGGHFENSAVYELIRRRLPHIVCCDCSQDPDFHFDDIGNLVRKARIDFEAEITFCTREELNRLKESQVPIPAWETLATPEEFVAVPEHRRHALLAKVRYEGSTTNSSLILLIKPALSGDEPLDLLQYKQSCPGFPHEPTTDQFFDEAQWESYRKLGEHSADHVFAGSASAPWWFTGLDPAKI